MSEQSFYVTGARRNSNEFQMDDLANSYSSVLYKLDFGKKRITREYIENSPSMEIYSKAYSFSFRGMSVYDDVIYTCTHSEILAIDKTTLNVLKRISDPVFNDLHHVDIIKGNIAFASTGIDHVGVIDHSGKVELFSCLPADVSRVLDDKIDYRTVSTKPHLSHPNYIFEIDSELWVTRFKQRDAVSLSDPTRKMDIGDESPHDGLVVGDKVYFTTVNGAIHVFDKRSCNKIEKHDLQSFYKRPKIGWCRGIEVVGDYAYIGFTRIRKTRSIDNLGFITDKWDRFMTTVKGTPPARIIKYDLKNRKIVDEMVLSNSQMSVIFSIRHAS